MTIIFYLKRYFIALLWAIIQKAIAFQIIYQSYRSRVRWHHYNKKIVKRYTNHEIQRLSSKRKDIRERKDGAGRSFKLHIKDRFLMLLIYYHLYITYTLAGFLFNLDQSNICRDIQKIESMIRKCIPIPQKICNITKRLRTPDEVEKYFPGFLAFIDTT